MGNQNAAQSKEERVSVKIDWGTWALSPTHSKKKKGARTEILELKNSTEEMNNELASLGNRANQMEERINDKVEIKKEEGEMA